MSYMQRIYQDEEFRKNVQNLCKHHIMKLWRGKCIFNHVIYKHKSSIVTPNWAILKCLCWKKCCIPPSSAINYCTQICKYANYKFTPSTLEEISAYNVFKLYFDLHHFHFISVHYYSLLAEQKFTCLCSSCENIKQNILLETC